MSFTTFNQNLVDVLHEPMFFGKNVNVARYEQQKHAIFERLIEKQLSFFCRREEVDSPKIKSKKTFGQSDNNDATVHLH